MQRKILAAVDGSVHSYNALRYLGQLFADQEEIVVHLLYVVPSNPVPIGQEWLSAEDRLVGVSPLVKSKMISAERFMKEAVVQLGRYGFAPDQLSTRVQLLKAGVAADVVYEARKGLYDALLIGRRGVSWLEEMLGGSLSNTVADKCYDLPIWVVDGEVDPCRFLLPVDRSFNSLKAADHLGFILQGNPNVEIKLLHLTSMFGGDCQPDTEALHEVWGEEWCRCHLPDKDSIFAGPEQILVERGLSLDQICRLREGRCVSPHGPIARQGADKYGTIVIGRRLKGQKKGFFKGVSDKVLAMASDVAIWVVG